MLEAVSIQIPHLSALSPPPRRDPGDRILTLLIGSPRRDRIDVNLSIAPEARFAMLAAISAFEQGQPGVALDLLDSVAHLGADRGASWHYLRGAALLKLGEDEQALVAFNNSLRIQPDSFAVSLCVVYSQMRLGNWDQAIRRLNRLGRAHHAPANLAAVCRLRGLAFMQTGKLPGAERDFRKAIDLDPKDPLPYDSLARIYAEQAARQGGMASPKVDEAIKLYERLARERPDLADPLVQIGAFLHRRDDLEGAIGAYTCALAIAPKDFTALERLGRVLVDAQRFEEATGIYEDLHARAQTDPLVLNMLAALYGVAERHAESATLLRRAIDMGSELGVTYANLGAALHALGRDQEAEQATRRALELDANDTGARQNLLEILRALGRPQSEGEDESARTTTDDEMPGKSEESGSQDRQDFAAPRVREALERAGLVIARPRRRTSQKFEPRKLSGKLLSEIVMEDRR